MKFNAQTIIEFFNRLDIKLRYCIFAAVLLLLAAADYMLVIRWQLNTLNKMGEEIKTASDNIGRVKADLLRMGKINGDMESQRSKLKTLSSKIRTVQEESAILEDIYNAANEFGVVIDQLTPMKDAQEKIVTAPEAKYYALPIVVGARSGYHMFGHFLNKLESANSLCMVRDLLIERSTKDAQTLTIQATLKMILVDRTPEPKK